MQTLTPRARTCGRLDGGRKEKKKCMKNNADPGPLLVLQRAAKRLEEGPQGGSQDPSSAPAPTHSTCMHICRSTHTRTMWAYAERKIRKKNKKQNQIFFFFLKKQHTGRDSSNIFPPRFKHEKREISGEKTSHGPRLVTRRAAAPARPLYCKHLTGVF